VPALRDAPLVHTDDRAAWRSWLEEHHATSHGCWLVTWRAGSGRPRLPYEEAVEEALCFGWVDGTGGSHDEDRGKLYFAPRKPHSGWAASNKARVARLIAEGRTTPAGLAAIERARANGSWEILDSVERFSRWRSPGARRLGRQGSPRSSPRRSATSEPAADPAPPRAADA